MGVRRKTTVDVRKDFEKKILWPTYYQEIVEKKCEIQGTMEDVEQEPDGEDNIDRLVADFMRVRDVGEYYLL